MTTDFLPALGALVLGGSLEVYTIILCIINLIKKKNFSGLSLASGVFFLYSLIYFFVHDKISIQLFLILLILLLLTRYMYFIASQWFEKRSQKNTHNTKE